MTLHVSIEVLPRVDYSMIILPELLEWITPFELLERQIILQFAEWSVSLHLLEWIFLPMCRVAVDLREWMVPPEDCPS